MNRNFAFFLALVIGIAIFAVVVMVQVPRRVVAVEAEAANAALADINRARTELAFSELRDGRGGIKVNSIAYTPAFYIAPSIKCHNSAVGQVAAKPLPDMNTA